MEEALSDLLSADVRVIYGDDVTDGVPESLDNEITVLKAHGDIRRPLQMRFDSAALARLPSALSARLGELVSTMQVVGVVFVALGTIYAAKAARSASVASQ